MPGMIPLAIAVASKSNDIDTVRYLFEKTPANFTKNGQSYSKYGYISQNETLLHLALKNNNINHTTLTYLLKKIAKNDGINLPTKDGKNNTIIHLRSTGMLELIKHDKKIAEHNQKWNLDMSLKNADNDTVLNILCRPPFLEISNLQQIIDIIKVMDRKHGKNDLDKIINHAGKENKRPIDQLDYEGSDNLTAIQYARYRRYLCRAGAIPLTSSKCPMRNTTKLMITVVVAISLLVITIVTFYMYQYRKRGIFTKSARSSVKLYEKVVPSDKQIPAKNIVLTLSNPIGNGRFSKVYRGVIGDEDVAIKVPKNVHRDNFDTVKDFLDEVENALALTRHRNILSIKGITWLKHRPDDYKEDIVTPCIVTKLLPLGSMKEYLQHEDSTHVTQNDLIGYSIDVAQGLDFLHKFNILHRDVAARNCLLDASNIRDTRYNLKLSDFGLSQKVKQNKLYQLIQDEGQRMKNKSEMLPVAWLALEILDQNYDISRDGFTVASDIWALGVTIWEFFTRCKTPYKGVPDLLAYLRLGNRLQKPVFCPNLVYGIMWQCWTEDVEARKCEHKCKF